jgi:hypothetical protein
MRDSRVLVRALSVAAAAAVCCAAIAAEHPPGAAAPSIVEESPAGPVTFVAARGADPLRGPTGQIVFDSISGCTGFARFQAAPAAILDDLSFVPGPASNGGAVIAGIDFYIRTWAPSPRITVRLSFYDIIDPMGQGDPSIVQHALASQQFLVIENAPANVNGPGTYLTVAALAPFVLLGPAFAVEIAYVDDSDGIIPNGTLSTVFPNSTCAATQPVIGSSQERFWIDNDFGDLTGDGIRYEPASPGVPGDQGDELAWGGGTPPDNVVAVRIRGNPIQSTTGACCASSEPFACMVTTPEACAAAGGTFIGLGEPCTPVFLCVPPPPNDLCENATVIAGEGPFPFDTRGAGSIGPEDCRMESPPFSVNSDVWFRWRAPCSGEFQIATCGLSVTDDRVAAYDASCDQLSQYGCDDNTCPAGFQSWLALSALGGREYLIRLGVYPNTPGGIGSLLIERIDGPCPICPLDFDDNGMIDVADIFAYLSAWFQELPEAQFFGGGEGVTAIFYFLNAWFAHGIGPC